MTEFDRFPKNQADELLEHHYTVTEDERRYFYNLAADRVSDMESRQATPAEVRAYMRRMGW